MRSQRTWSGEDGELTVRRSSRRQMSALVKTDIPIQRNRFRCFTGIVLNKAKLQGSRFWQLLQRQESSAYLFQTQYVEELRVQFGPSWQPMPAGRRKSEFRRVTRMVKILVRVRIPYS